MKTALRSPRSTLTALASVGILLAAGTLTACGSSSSGGSSETTSGDTPASSKSTASSNSTSGAASGPAALVPKAIRDMDTVEVPSSMDFPPFEYFAAGSSTPMGLDVDIMAAIGSVLNINFKFVNTKFDSIIPSLANGRYQIALSSMTDSLDREKQTLFVDYFLDGSRVVVKKGNPENITTLGDLSGKNVGSSGSSTDLDILKKVNTELKAAGKPEAHISTFPNAAQALLAVDSGRVVADMSDASSAAYTVKTTGKYELVGPLINVTPYGINLPLASTDFAKAVQAALDTLKASGKYSAILTKWGFANDAINVFTIQGASKYAATGSTPYDLTATS